MQEPIHWMRSAVLVLLKVVVRNEESDHCLVLSLYLLLTHSFMLKIDGPRYFPQCLRKGLSGGCLPRISLEKGSTLLTLKTHLILLKRNKVCQKYQNFIRGDPYKLGLTPRDQQKISSKLHESF